MYNVVQVEAFKMNSIYISKHLTIYYPSLF